MKNNLKIIPVAFLVVLAHFLPFNLIVGSINCTFSWSSMIAPVIADQFGLGWVWLLCVSKKMFSMKVLSLYGIIRFAFHRLPLFFSSRAFQKKEWATSIILPATCMVLFSYHEVGRVAWVYSLYWIIPMALFFVRDLPWSRALSASFVAHAVGSVVWLYTASIPACVWIGLIPVVFIERLLIAGGILICNYLVVCLGSYFKSLKKHQSFVQTGPL
ncbi:MAG: hypothetical protein NTU89_01535 [Candidatus Dependentiae bacterium]|nr:hypothetical protein [Candidatus Dependentiae bacterium]